MIDFTDRNFLKWLRERELFIVKDEAYQWNGTKDEYHYLIKKTPQELYDMYLQGE